MKQSEEPKCDPKEVLTRVVNAITNKDFFRSILLNDTFDDWNLARDFGIFLTRIEPEEIMGHALLARAYRHLGEPENALAELGQCRVRVAHPSEKELFMSFLSEEERLLSRVSQGESGMG